ncbi:MAG TPA: hypothetical protein VJU78_20175 [Chitinophagaceae bacterium]|nr:hypothetical protein [Chitinophagaceae bacterium]
MNCIIPADKKEQYSLQFFGLQIRLQKFLLFSAGIFVAPEYKCLAEVHAGQSPNPGNMS